MTTLPTPRLSRRPVDAGAKPSQLDLIAEVNSQAASQHRGHHALHTAVVSVAVMLLAALWWFTQGGAVRTPVTPASPAAAASGARLDRSAAVGQSALAASAPAELAWPDPAAAQTAGALAALAAADVTAASAAVGDGRARTARTRREGEARAAAELLVQQARLQLEAQDRQQREAEREAQQVRELADAATRAAAQAPARAQTGAEPPRGVRERCLASGNVVSEFLCHSRECRKPDHASDALCTRLREIEEARRHSGQ